MRKYDGNYKNSVLFNSFWWILQFVPNKITKRLTGIKKNCIFRKILKNMLFKNLASVFLRQCKIINYMFSKFKFSSVFVFYFNEAIQYFFITNEIGS